MPDQPTPTLAAALVAAFGAMPNVPKTEQSNYGKFADLATIMKMTRTVLATNGLAVSQWPTYDDDGRPILITRLIHTSGETMEERMRLFGGDTPQGQGSAITYARRYAYCAVLGIAPEGEDDDGREAQVRSSVRRERPAPRRNDPEPPAPLPEDGPALPGIPWSRVDEANALIQRLGPSGKRAMFDWAREHHHQVAPVKDESTAEAVLEHLNQGDEPQP